MLFRRTTLWQNYSSPSLGLSCFSVLFKEVLILIGWSIQMNGFSASALHLNFLFCGQHSLTMGKQCAAVLSLAESAHTAEVGCPDYRMGICWMLSWVNSISLAKEGHYYLIHALLVFCLQGNYLLKMRGGSATIWLTKTKQFSPNIWPTIYSNYEVCMCESGVVS